jgi:hypothetical protein
LLWLQYNQLQAHAPVTFENNEYSTWTQFFDNPSGLTASLLAETQINEINTSKYCSRSQH